VWASTLVTATLWYLTQTHKPIEIIAGLGTSPLLQQNLDYLPSLFRGWLHEVAPFMMIEQTGGGGVITGYKTSLPWQMLTYMSGGVLVGITVSLFTRQVSTAKLDHFFRLLRTPVYPGEKPMEPCTLPPDAPPPQTGKLIPIASLEIPRPSAVGLIGFAAAWVMVGLVILFTWWLSRLGSAGG
jgi:hypothetical protein